MTKRFKSLSLAVMSIILAIMCTFMYCTDNYRQTKASTEAITRNIEVSKNAVDYETYFEQFDDVSFVPDEKLSTISLVQTVDDEFLSEINNNSSTTHYKGEVCYDIEYDHENNKVYLNATLYLDEENNCLFEKVEGVACWNENIKDVDIVFESDDGVIFLSDLNENINNCGWFRKALNFVKKHAVQIVAVVAVVATVAVAAPAFVAAATAVVSTGGGTAAIGGGITAGLVAAGSAIASSTLVGATVAAAAVTAGAVAGAIIVETIAEGIEQIKDKTTGAILEIVYKGVHYASTLLTASVVSTLAKDAYFMALANPTDGAMYYCATAIDKNFAISIMAANTAVSVYTYYEYNARSIAQQAGNNMSPIWERHHAYGYFDHYHLGNLSIRDERHQDCLSHAFYGLPQFN